MASPAAAFVLPNRDSLSLGERVIAYLPRCADTSTEVRKVAVQVSAKIIGAKNLLIYT